MFSRFFINRPIFAAVLSIIIIMAGLVTLQSLPVSQYPEIAPPTVQVNAIYPGANAIVLADTVAQPIEEQVNGAEGMLYMSSTCTNNGQYSLTVTFEVGTDLDMAQVLVQNRVSQAESMLPEEVQRMGLTVEKQSNNILLFAALTSPDGNYDALYLGNYASLRIRDELTRLEGVGSVMIFGAADYSMRIWLDPERMKARGLTTTDVVSAIGEQNVQVAAGQIGQPPTRNLQDYQYTLNVRGRLEEVSQFEDIIVRSLPGGRMIRVRDIARVELGAQTYNVSSQTGGKDSAAIGIFLQPGANALEVAESVKIRMAELARSFPPGLEYEIPFDTTMFVEASIDEVIETLCIAVILVIIVILIFLQNWRATLIPVATIPVSLIGTFAVMSALDVGINMLSLFGIVLAIGIVVDDAIVVVENVMRNIDESGLNSKDATIQAMTEVTGPIVATTLVLLAVFIPTAFLGGITGQLYRQFALTIATATVFSSINALTLSPALSALLLKPAPKSSNFFARGFNWFFDRLQKTYGFIVGGLIRRAFIMVILFIGLSGATYWGFTSLPKGFVPNEDQGWAIIAIQLPDAASLQRTKEVVETINQRLAKMPGMKNFVSVPGYSLMDSAVTSNSAAIWTVFDPWEERLPAGLNLDAMIGQLWGAVTDIQEAVVYAFPPPPIMGLGNAGGFEMQIQDRGNLGLNALQNEAYGMMMAANTQGSLRQVFTTFRANVPQLHAEVDRTQTKSMGIPLTDVFKTLQANLGSVYVNDFNKFGRTYQVRIQADSNFRTSTDDIRRLEVRNSSGDMVPLGTVVKVSETLGPQIITRYNMYPSAKLNGQGGPGISSGAAMEIMEKIAAEKLPAGMGYEWTGMSFQEKAAQGQTLFIFILAVIFVYLILCAQYESWSLPLTVILAVPLAVLGTVIAVAIRGMDINVYTQVGIVLLIALTCKTAILIAEFAKASREEGQSIFDSALNAARLRFRPILMTAATFILGVFSLVIATGAGAAGRQALGTAVFSGMIAATVLLIFFVPAFYALIQKASEKVGGRHKADNIDKDRSKSQTPDFQEV
ncbi:multidrug efflux RND transporter permease subunit [Desulfobacterales bacterium HSG16]|nr:multidrug efflux RND transporter permease subunit [Desulfobacterales bacterium HSG16]